MGDKIIGVVPIPPSTNIISVLANSGYSIEQAIADIVDNSVSNQAKTIDITFKRNLADSYIEITDDGIGMNRDVLIKALTYADKSIDECRKSTDLGRYGVGLKAASSSFCDKLQVISKGNNGLVNSFVFPFRTKKWEIQEVEVPDNSIETDTGTRIICKDLTFSADVSENKSILFDDSETFYEIVEKVSRHLQKIFALFLKNGLIIKVNGNKLDPWLPDEIPGANVATKTFNYYAGKVKIVSCTLPVAQKMTDVQRDYACFYGNKGLTDNQGFFVYRNNRLIVDGGWLHIKGLKVDQKCNYARVCVYYESTPELDGIFGVNFQKSDVTVAPELSSKLKKIAEEARANSIKSANYKINPRPHKRNSGAGPVSVWDITRSKNRCYFSINRNHPLIKKYTEGLNSNTANALFNLLSKDFPISELSESFPKEQRFTISELEQMVRDSIKEKNDGKLVVNEKVTKDIFNESPFNKDVYKNDVASILVKISMELDKHE